MTCADRWQHADQNTFTPSPRKENQKPLALGQRAHLQYYIVRAILCPDGGHELHAEALGRTADAVHEEIHDRICIWIGLHAVVEEQPSHLRHALRVDDLFHEKIVEARTDLLAPDRALSIFYREPRCWEVRLLLPLNL